FAAFPDDWATLRQEGLAFFRYSVTEAGAGSGQARASSVDDLIAEGLLRFDPIIYEDFLPVSAAGIFQSNLGSEDQRTYASNANRSAFEAALGAKVCDNMELYARAEQESLQQALLQLKSPHFGRTAIAR
ncbi:MAG: DUF1338 domain-containing protein, partial [Bradyrhizobium sp.]|nr:DUF1338 domain-containing protein [Bradyrhizobium sp.]